MSMVQQYSILGEQGTATQAVVGVLTCRANYHLAIAMWTSAPPERAPRWFLAVCEALQAFVDASFALDDSEPRKACFMREAAADMKVLIKVRPFVGRVGRA